MSPQRELARLAIYVDGFQHAEVLSFGTVESATAQRDAILQAVLQGAAGLVTIGDDYGCQLTVSYVSIRIVRLMIHAP